MSIDASPAGVVASHVITRITGQRSRFLRDLAHFAAIDSPSDDAAGLARAAEWLDRFLSPLGQVTRFGNAGSATLLLEVGTPAADGAPLVLCHYDTVWPAGTATSWPMTVADGWVRGPGVLDMKGSIVLVRYVIAALQRLGVPLPRGLRVLITCDEEIGNPTSAEIVTTTAARAGAALVMEPPSAGGALKTARKGFAVVRCDVQGRPAHAGVEPGKGVSATAEAALLLLDAHAMSRPDRGVTVNVGVMRGGTRPNVVAEHAELVAEVRAHDDDELARVLDALAARPPVTDGARHAWSVLARRAPMPRVQATVALFELARQVSDALGHTVTETTTGGVSEG
jgi:glutamate carboxypeptidase